MACRSYSDEGEITQIVGNLRRKDSCSVYASISYNAFLAHFLCNVRLTVYYDINTTLAP